MTEQFRSLFRLTLLLLVAGSALGPAIAQQGQYFEQEMPFTLKGMKSTEGLATYSPIKSVNGQTIQLRSDDGQVFTFTLDADTVYCQGGFRVSDWTYLLGLGKKATVTVLTSDYTDKRALVVWDQPPSLSTSKGSFVFAFPPLCK
jgi:hypothetical protein